MPDAVIIAGANGAGKTTFARSFVPDAFPNARFLNADEIQREAPPFAKPARAAREMIARLEQCVESRTDFVVETTLSSTQYRRRFLAWRKQGFTITLIFLELPNPDFAVARVSHRVSQGGHDIPEADIRRRFERGLFHLHETYLNQVDVWYHFKWTKDRYELFHTGTNENA